MVTFRSSSCLLFAPVALSPPVVALPVQALTKAPTHSCCPFTFPMRHPPLQGLAFALSAAAATAAAIPSRPPPPPLCLGPRRLSSRRRAATRGGVGGGAPRRYPTAKARVEVVTLGRRSTKDAAFDGPVDTYITRAGPRLDISCRWVTPATAAATLLSGGGKVGAGGGGGGGGSATGGPRAHVICLDEGGAAPASSDAFAALLYDRLERGGSRVVFVIGEADGLPPAFREAVRSTGRGPAGGVEALSLSPLTLPHKLVRLVLVEQLYRASEIRRGSKYNK
ncbi:hypothetical protein I4F81_000135 [Pyropia yezoensis]|uniref:Uncharacterized protein n=1 Tax=Pyropia yezoensis TaxID=2788 RepID=A0ACC3BIR2_PYRYE|nr:hypothetical protein I4F81_000135 [Neopyropia yezoensis]